MNKTPILNAVLTALFLLAAPGRPADPAPATVQVDEGDALLRQWVQPEYPASARAAKAEGRVTVHFVVEADGSVTRASVAKSSDPQFDAAALAAVQRWTFSPALSEGRPVATVVFRLDQLKQKRVPLQPSRAEMPAPLPKTKAKMKTSPNPDYPEELADRQLSGQVDLEFTVGADGLAHAPKILWASHPAFVGAALQALGRCEFEPARHGPLVQPEVLRAPMEFTSLGVDRAAVLEANHITVPLKDSLDVLPSPLVMIEPVHPLERLLAAETGSATVEFAVNERGHVGPVVLVSATQPDFGAALVAAVEAWLFNPGQKGGQTVAASLRVTHEFTPPVGGAAGRLVAALQPGGTGIGGAGGLDRKLAPLWRGFPVYPAELKAEHPTGKAQIEFVIDREGRARLPRVVSATHAAFGWAAATAISQWVFEPPVRGGQPVDVRVSIPVGFSPPKE